MNIVCKVSEEFVECYPLVLFPNLFDPWPVTAIEAQSLFKIAKELFAPTKLKGMLADPVLCPIAIKGSKQFSVSPVALCAAELFSGRIVQGFIELLPDHICALLSWLLALNSSWRRGCL